MTRSKQKLLVIETFEPDPERQLEVVMAILQPAFDAGRLFKQEDEAGDEQQASTVASEEDYK